jgi:hypothetical protein
LDSGVPQVPTYSSNHFHRPVTTQTMGHVAHMGEKRNVYRVLVVLVGKPELKTGLGRLAQMKQEN